MKIPSKVVMVSVAIGIAFLSLASVTSASAATPRFGKKYQGGVANTTVWLNYSSGVGYWESFIVLAANNWKSPGWSNPINITFLLAVITAQKWTFIERVIAFGSANMAFLLKRDSIWLAELRFNHRPQIGIMQIFI